MKEYVSQSILPDLKIPITPSISVRADHEKMLREFNNRFERCEIITRRDVYPTVNEFPFIVKNVKQEPESLTG